MEIPRLDLDIPIKKIPFSEESGTWDITKETGSAYWLEGTSHPEFGGNTVIAAHYMELGEPGPLFRVRDLQEGDEIILYSENVRYAYKVERYQYIPATYTEYMKNRPYALTLFTCSGFNWDTGIWEQRVVVLADLVQIDIASYGKQR
ncbi:MAG: class F sortase [Flexilinea sp.]|nr:class F sortase [Flexilinea sp.]